MAGLTAWILSVVAVLIWLRRRREKVTANTPIKGDQLSDADIVKTLIRTQGSASDLVFGQEQLPLPRLAELQQFWCMILPGQEIHRY